MDYGIKVLSGQEKQKKSEHLLLSLRRKSQKTKNIFTTEAQRTQRKILKMVSRACGAANKGIGFSSVSSVPLW